MYGHPKSGLYGHKPNPSGRKRGRPSAWSKFIEKQRDLFPADVYTAKLTAAHMAARQTGEQRPAVQGAAGAQTAARSAALPPVTKRGGKVNKTKELKRLESMGYSEKDLEESNPYNQWMRAI